MNARKSVWNVRLLVAGIAALTLMNPVSGSAAELQPEELEAIAQDVMRAATQELQPSVSEYEQTRHRRVIEAPAAEYRSGAWQAISGKNIVYLNQRAAVLQALEKNLVIESSRDDVERAKQAVREAKAVFHPTFVVNLSYSENESNSRTQFGQVNKKAFQPTFNPPIGGVIAFQGETLPFLDIDGIRNLTGAPLPPDPRTQFLIFNQQQRQTNVPQRIIASKSDTRPDIEFGFNVLVDQQLPWGAQVTVSSVTRRNKIFYRSGSDNGKYWDEGMYTSDVTLNFSSGVPFGKNFGPYSPADARKKLAKKRRQQSRFELQETINGILRDSDIAFWFLVRSLEELHVTIENRDLIGQQAAQMARLFELQRATTYQKAQIDAELAKVNIRVEQARAAYIDASHFLATLIENADADVRSKLYVPFGFSDTYLDWLQTDYATALETAEANRPSGFVRRTAREFADIRLRANKTAARPDIAINIGIISDQDGSLHGYGGIADSHQHVNRPDTLIQNYGLTFVRPLKNKAARARVNRARLDLEDRDLGVRDDGQAMRREITDRMVALGNTRLRHDINVNEVARFKEAVAGLERKQRISADVSQDEIILTSRNLLNAELDKILALIDNKIEETRLLFAQGTLASEYGPRTKISEFDGKRMELLAAEGHLDYFEPLKPASAGEDDKIAAPVTN